jgi:hypothetical protein
LFFAYSRDPDMAVQLVEEQIADTQARLQQLEDIQFTQPTGKIFNQMGLDLRIRQLNSILDWLISCRETLANSQKGAPTA